MGMQQRLPAFSFESEYYDHVARGYDLISATYDLVEATNVVGRRARRHIQAALFRTFHAGDLVLEIGCGTGLEATALAARGVRVVATDLSERMVERMRELSRQHDLERIVARRMAAYEIGSLADEYGEALFDGAYSHGGVLNMDPRIREVADGLARLLRPGARFLCTVVNHASLFETVFYPLVLRPRKAFRRLGHTVPIPITRHEAHREYVVPTTFYSPRAFERVFERHFVRKRLEGLQILLPPWNLADELEKIGGIGLAVERIEDTIAVKPPFNEWGSLFIMELERTHDT